MSKQTITIELTEDQAELTLQALATAQQAAGFIARWRDLSTLQLTLAKAMVKLSRPIIKGQNRKD